MSTSHWVLWRFRLIEHVSAQLHSESRRNPFILQFEKKTPHTRRYDFHFVTFVHDEILTFDLVQRPNRKASKCQDPPCSQSPAFLTRPDLFWHVVNLKPRLAGVKNQAHFIKQRCASERYTTYGNVRGRHKVIGPWKVPHLSYYVFHPLSQKNLMLLSVCPLRGMLGRKKVAHKFPRMVHIHYESPLA